MLWSSEQPPLVCPHGLYMPPNSLDLDRVDCCSKEDLSLFEYVSYIFRSRAYTQNGSLEVSFFRMSITICMSTNFAKFNIYVKLNYGTPHMTIYGPKWTGSAPEVGCEDLLVFLTRSYCFFFFENIL